MSGQVETTGTGPPELLEAMLGYVRRRGHQAERVTGYLERSYNIGYCETCSEMISEVRIFYARPDGSEGHHQVEYQGLAELIRELTDDPATTLAWKATATFEDADAKWDRYEVHSFDEEPERE
jgi:hypothetical protein